MKAYSTSHYLEEPLLSWKELTPERSQIRDTGIQRHCVHLPSQYNSILVKHITFERKTLTLALPHPAQIRKWHSKAPAEPGFTEPAVDALQASVISAREKGHEVLSSFMIDEIAIRTHAEWEGQKYCGFVDLGTGIGDNDLLPLAKNGLAFMVVAVNSTWKVPCA